MQDNTTTIAELRKIMADFVAQRGWEPFHDPKNLASSIAIEAAELMEHFQWLRSDELADLQEDKNQMAAIRSEVADILAYVLSFANSMGIDLSEAFKQKMKANGRKYPADEFRGRFRKG